MADEAIEVISPEANSSDDDEVLVLGKRTRESFADSQPAIIDEDGDDDGDVVVQSYAKRIKQEEMTPVFVLVIKSAHIVVGRNVPWEISVSTLECASSEEAMDMMLDMIRSGMCDQMDEFFMARDDRGFLPGEHSEHEDGDHDETREDSQGHLVNIMWDPDIWGVEPKDRPWGRLLDVLTNEPKRWTGRQLFFLRRDIFSTLDRFRKNSEKVSWDDVRNLLRRLAHLTEGVADLYTRDAGGEWPPFGLFKICLAKQFYEPAK